MGSFAGGGPTRQGSVSSSHYYPGMPGGMPASPDGLFGGGGGGSSFGGGGGNSDFGGSEGSWSVLSPEPPANSGYTDPANATGSAAMDLREMVVSPMLAAGGSKRGGTGSPNSLVSAFTLLHCYFNSVVLASVYSLLLRLLTSVSSSC
jgi:hypothetical protein